ncbi:MAG TPA: AraC family transcriptional regulator [Longimicrobiales bacterium]|nr:AraC family transcriptional regulator [Longimicrobiales bacterium]
MSSLPATAAHTLALFQPPYAELTPCTTSTVAELRHFSAWKGKVLVWQLNGGAHQQSEYEALRDKTPGLPLMILLPPPSELRRALDLLPLLRSLGPRGVLPHGFIDSAHRLRQALGTPPGSLGAAVVTLIERMGITDDRKVLRELHRIIELSATTRSIAMLSRRMYTSRRTLGRHFEAHGLPVPSHCLHFGRLLHVALQLQGTDTAMFRIAGRFGYPDGFTMSNQMKRLTGFRPTQVRELLGWEWLVEAWIRKERGW